jgi:predicted SAM-dependent methyltransferase
MGIKLDIGCALAKPLGYLGMDKREAFGVDVVHDWNVYPWPFEDNTFQEVRASHVIEHINPADGGFLRWMDEVWRICEPGGRLMISVPHGRSDWYLQDPTHCNQCNEVTFTYFDPAHGMYGVYRPKPWEIVSLKSNPRYAIDVVLVKRG